MVNEFAIDGIAGQVVGDCNQGRQMRNRGMMRNGLDREKTFLFILSDSAIGQPRKATLPYAVAEVQGQAKSYNACTAGQHVVFLRVSV